MERMATQSPDQVAPVPVHLPESPGDESFSPVQWEVMKALMTTVLPSLSRQSAITNRTVEGTVSDEQYEQAVNHMRQTMANAPNDEELEEYLAESPYDTEVWGTYHHIVPFV